MTYNFTPEQLLSIVARIRKLGFDTAWLAGADTPRSPQWFEKEVLAILTSGQPQEHLPHERRTCEQCKGIPQTPTCSGCAGNGWYYTTEPTSGPQQEPPSTCPRCEGTGKYSRLPGTEKPCAVCNGTGKISEAEATGPAQSTEPQEHGPLRDPHECHYCQHCDRPIHQEYFGGKLVWLDSDGRMFCGNRGNFLLIDHEPKTAPTPASGAAQDCCLWGGEKCRHGKCLNANCREFCRECSAQANEGQPATPCGAAQGTNICAECGEPINAHKYDCKVREPLREWVMGQQPAPVTTVKEYKHWPWCNGDRKIPAGETGHGCCCFNEHAKSITEPVTPVGQIKTAEWFEVDTCHHSVLQRDCASCLQTYAQQLEAAPPVPHCPKCGSQEWMTVNWAMGYVEAVCSNWHTTRVNKFRDFAQFFSPTLPGKEQEG